MNEKLKNLRKKRDTLRQKKLQAQNQPTLPKNPVEFAQQLFKFKPYEYQAKLLTDNNKRIVVRWSRQAGKTTCIASRAIWFAATYPKTLTLIVAPSLRQSMIMRDRIQDFLMNMDKHYRLQLIEKLQRTVIHFRNGSRIVALPNNPQLLRGYTAHQVIADEANFFKDDELVFYNVLYPMLSTTDGTLIAISTPWNKDSVFYHMCQNTEYSSHVVTCEEVKNAGLIKQSFIDNMRTQLPTEFFQREFMAEFVEDIDAWLSQSLIVQSIDSKLQLYDFQDQPKGEFYAGVDFGKETDHSVILVTEKSGSTLKVIHVHRFPIETEYASVIGYVKSITDRWREIRAIYADVTGVGNYIVEDMIHSGIHNVTGINFTVQSKEEMATILREKMRTGEIKIPYAPTRNPEDVNLTAELNIEKCELMKTGHLRFSHPEGSHDDVFWSTALAVYASAQSPLPGVGVRLLQH